KAANRGGFLGQNQSRAPYQQRLRHDEEQRALQSVRSVALMAGPELLRLHVEGRSLLLEVSLWLSAAVLVLFLALRFFVRSRKSLFHKYELVKLNVQLGNVGSVEFRPNNEDVQIAHRIWTELMTRKAAQPI